MICRLQSVGFSTENIPRPPFALERSAAFAHGADAGNGRDHIWHYDGEGHFENSSGRNGAAQDRITVVDADENAAHDDRAFYGAFDDRRLKRQPKKFLHLCPDFAAFNPSLQAGFI
jgi:hypothetical protein